MAALVLDATAKDNGGYVYSALEKVTDNLDIVFINLPDSLDEAELAIRQVYAYCLSKASEIDCTVYPFLINTKKWDTIYSSVPLPGVDTTAIEPIACPRIVEKRADNEPTKIRHHAVAAVGGTFDHFHVGHKLLITITGLWSTKKIIVGVTGPELLKNKKYAEYLESFDKRKDAVGDFIARIFPDLEFAPYEINDIYGPTGTVEAIDALVVSQETSSGGKAVNDFRVSKNWNALAVFEVGLIEALSGTEKLSSTQLRKADATAATKI